MLRYNSTPVQDLSGHATFARAGIRVFIKREDMNHPTVSGNKWWKLKYNLHEAVKKRQSTLLTFGGAYSNHIYATAAACAELKIKCIGIIRGEETLPLNTTLQFAREMGMEIYYISRTDYRLKDSPTYLEGLRQKFGDFYLIPEGGSNALAVKGCAEFAETELSRIAFDHLCLPVGTGGTMAGLICGLEDKKNVLGVPVLKNGEFLRDEISKLIVSYSGMSFTNWSLRTQYHHGGYAKVTPELCALVAEMKGVFNVPLDRVYTAKLFWAVLREAEAGAFPEGSTVLVIHTGGLQGNLSPSA